MTPRDGGNARRWAVALAVALVYGWWAVSLPAFSAEATAAVVGAGAAAMLAGHRWGRRRPPPRRAAGAAWWAVVVAAAAAWQLAAYLQSPREDHPTLSSLANAVLDSHPARAAAFAVWIVAGVSLARR